jgi:hypothetical protein
MIKCLPEEADVKGLARGVSSLARSMGLEPTDLAKALAGEGSKLTVTANASKKGPPDAVMADLAEALEEGHKMALRGLRDALREKVDDVVKSS